MDSCGPALQVIQ